MDQHVNKGGRTGRQDRDADRVADTGGAGTMVWRVARTSGVSVTALL
jgi:hypothetical protein